MTITVFGRSVNEPPQAQLHCSSGHEQVPSAEHVPPLISQSHAPRVEQAHTNAPVHPFKCRCNQCPHFDNDPDVDANDDLIMTERVGDFEVGMSVDVPHHYGNLTGVIEYIYFSEGDPCLCIYFEEVPRYGLRGQRQDVFVSVLLEALGREE